MRVYFLATSDYKIPKGTFLEENKKWKQSCIYSLGVFFHDLYAQKSYFAFHFDWQLVRFQGNLAHVDALYLPVNIRREIFPPLTENSVLAIDFVI